MTRQRDFKKLVRERIEATGERYTTARSHVLNKLERTETYPGLIPGYRQFGGQQGDTAVLSHVLHFAGVKHSEAMVHGLCGGVGFLYAVFEYKGHAPMLTIVARSSSMPDLFTAEGLKRAGAQHDVKETSGAAGAQKHLDAALAANKPAMLTVDIASLPYSGMPKEWQGMGPHMLAAIGRDGDAVWLDDRSVRPIRISMKELAFARGRYKKGKHRLVTIYGTEKGHDPSAAIRNAIAYTVKSFHESPFKGFASNFGFAGLEKFQRLLTDKKDAKGWPKLFTEGRNACTGLHRVYECLQHDYTAPNAGRSLYADFLAEAAGVTGDKRLNELAGKFRESGKLWGEVTQAVTDCGEKSLRRMCELTDQRAELFDTEGAEAGPQLADMWKQRRELADESKLTASQCSDLYARMSDTLKRVLEVEHDAVDQMNRLTK